MFALLLCFCLYILLKYLVGKSKGQQTSMITFYVLSAVDLGTRICYFTASCFMPQTNSLIYNISAVSAEASICVGVSHSANLGRVILDLAVLQKQTSAEQHRVERKSIYIKILIVFWGFMLAWLTFLVVEKMAYLMEFVNFLLLGTQLLVLNLLLLRLMKKFMEQTSDKLEREKNSLICTLIVFSISYFLKTIRFVVLYILKARSEHQYWFCKNTSSLSIMNVTFFLIVEWMPYTIVFMLNF